VKKIILGLVLLVLMGCVAPCYAYSTEKAVSGNWYAIQPAQISVYFPREGQDPAPVLSNIYNMANNTIDIAIYSLTNPTIINAIESAKARGIKVRIITDRMESKNKYQAEALARLNADGVPILINSHSGLMHLKMSVIDRTFVTTGSYNYSLDASQTNDEVMVVCTESNTITQCENEFEHMWNDSKSFTRYGGN
jgi:phosphatidylserine/phosphatidylglycerophosphate/cardiolipin synthase-like enzyme